MVSPSRVTGYRVNPTALAAASASGLLAKNIGCSGSLNRLSPNRKTQALLGVRKTRETMGVVIFSPSRVNTWHLPGARVQG